MMALLSNRATVEVIRRSYTIAALIVFVVNVHRCPSKPYLPANTDIIFLELIGGGGHSKREGRVLISHTYHTPTMTMARLLRRVTSTATILLRVLSTTANYACAFTTKSYSPPSTPRDYQRQQRQLQHQYNLRN